ncbi:hypothetical protein Salat_0707700 [Sesamum alatum]|uniref:DUF4283 domain-containing protein n=1 Tax=Sesamum alatum TaxID=300844 RepID=A0AAE1YSV3_9LAMI|nr:hypothetical protein Salat_0707700 [Sesamum alatum]
MGRDFRRVCGEVLATVPCRSAAILGLGLRSLNGMLQRSPPIYTSRLASFLIVVAISFRLKGGTGAFILWQSGLLGFGGCFQPSGVQGDMGGIVGQLKRGLLLTEDEDSRVAMPDDARWQGSSQHHLCLVGRVLTKNPYNFEGFCRSIKGMISAVKDLEVQQLPLGRLLLRFSHIIDRNRALAGCSWSFERNLVILSSINADENPMQVDLNWCEFHVQIHDLPLSHMTLPIATLIEGSEAPIGVGGGTCGYIYLRKTSELLLYLRALGPSEERDSIWELVAGCPPVRGGRRMSTQPTVSHQIPNPDSQEGGRRGKEVFGYSGT